MPKTQQPEYTQTVYDAISKSQEVAVNVATAWADHVQSTWDGFLGQASSEPKVPSPVEIVGATFDSLEKLLDLQRDYYTGLADAYAPLFEQVTSDVRTAASTLAVKN
jgi:hypothetical protein